jgi:malonyl-CoA O-methyltransferase
MFDTKQVGQDFSNAASAYDTYAALQQQVLTELINKALPKIPQGAFVLDAGCGTGRLGQQLKQYPIAQLDVAYAMCAKAAGPDAPAINGSVDALPFTDNTFDVVFSSLVLQWVPDWKKAMEEMQRVLKPGGLLAISTFGPHTLKELKESFAAVDKYSHVSSFIPREAFAETQTITEYYPDVLALMRHLKIIGARNKLLGRRKSIMTRGQMTRVEQRYKERFGVAAGLPVTWEILYSVIVKP